MGLTELFSPLKDRLEVQFLIVLAADISCFAAKGVFGER